MTVSCGAVACPIGCDAAGPHEPSVDRSSCACAGPALDQRLMDPSREGGLLAWQYRNYPDGHRDRRNLAVHAATAPLFVVGTGALMLTPFVTGSLLAIAVPALTLPIVLQGRSHRLERTRPMPFRGPGDFLLRVFVEQWVTFPRYLVSGGFTRAWRAAEPRQRARPA